MSETRTYELGGGKYTATQNADGTWNILDVPICGEVPAGEKFAKKPVDLAWLKAAVETHLQRYEKEKFEAPLHIHHHGTQKETIPAGHFIPRRVGKIQHSGETSNAIFADLTRIPAEIFSLIEQGKFPYISVELASWEDGEFTSCSLLDDERPYFAFPNLTVGTKVHSFTAEAERIAKPSGMAVAFRATGTGGMILCKFGGGIKLNDDESEKKDESAGEDKPKFPAKKDGESDKDEKPKDGDKPADPAQSEDQMTILKQILTTLNLVAKNLSGVGGVAAGAKNEDENKAPVEQEPPMNEDKSKQKPAASDEVTVKLASLEGEVLGLKAKDAEREKADQAKARADKAIESLKGWHLTEDIRKKIALYAGEPNVKLLDAFVESIKTNVPKDPPPTLAGYEGAVGMASANDPDVDKVLLAYQNRGPEALEHARRFVRLHAEAKAQGLTRLPVESLVAAQFRGLEARLQVNGVAH